MLRLSILAFATIVFAGSTLASTLQDSENPPTDSPDVQEITSEQDPPKETSKHKERDVEVTSDRPLTYEEALQQEVATLRRLLAESRTELAQVKLERDQTQRELEELQQFIQDHREYGNDFAQYEAFRAKREREERLRRAEETRARLEQERQERLTRRNEQLAKRGSAIAAQKEQQKYNAAGFEPLGMDVYLGRSGFYYGVRRSIRAQVEYEPFIGDFLEPVETTEIDFSEMTISGTILNGSDETRNIGVAVAFFDRRGNQVGSETIQINNARPDVPYPFTSKIQMGLDGPFASSSSWVLYADPVQPKIDPDAVDTKDDNDDETTP